MGLALLPLQAFVDSTKFVRPQCFTETDRKDISKDFTADFIQPWAFF